MKPNRSNVNASANNRMQTILMEKTMNTYTADQPSRQNASVCMEADRPGDQNMARSLRTMVRRIIRRRRYRTRFEVRVWDEARRLMEAHSRDFSTEALARAITDRLLASPNRKEFLACLSPTGDPRLATWANAVGNTVAV